MASLGESWKLKFMRKLQPVMYDMVLYRYTSEPTQCPGAFNTNGDYDLEADTEYHVLNPSSPECSNGIIGTPEHLMIKGFYFDNLDESMIKLMNIGDINENEGVFIADGYTDLTNAICIEYPTGTYYQFVFIRDLKIADSVITQYGKLRVSPGVL